jgi:hypothetical protein
MKTMKQAIVFLAGLMTLAILAAGCSLPTLEKPAARAILDPQFRFIAPFRADLSLQAFRLGREKGAVTKHRAD